MHDVLVRIRRARGHEAHEVAEVWLRSRAASIPAIPPPVHTPEEVHAWLNDVVLPTKEAWVAEVDGVLVGVLVLDDDWIDQLYILPAHTGSGLGAELVNLAKQRRESQARARPVFVDGSAASPAFSGARLPHGVAFLVRLWTRYDDDRPAGRRMLGVHWQELRSA